MKKKTNELLAEIAVAVVENDDEAADLLLGDLFAAEMADAAGLGHVVDRVLEILDSAVDSENRCGFFIFVRIEQVFENFGDTGKEGIKSYVSLNYGKFGGVVAMEMAEFVGGFRDSWAVEVVESWVSDRRTFTVDAAHFIGVAIRELLGEVDGADRDEGYRARVRKLESELARDKQPW